jgi:hypothetical protein
MSLPIPRRLSSSRGSVVVYTPAVMEVDYVVNFLDKIKPETSSAKMYGIIAGLKSQLGLAKGILGTSF